jgi:aminoglycoside phosphotransferase (APT) family kinase protein
VGDLTWLDKRSVGSVRRALTRRAPDLAGRSVILQPWIEQSDARWSAGTALVDGRVVAKFAWSKLAAERLWYEARILRSLAPQSADLRLPEVVLASDDPVLVITRLVKGNPLTYELVGGTSNANVDQIGSELALYLSNLHQPEILSRINHDVGPLDVPRPQATTADLRDRVAPWVRANQLEMIYRWCDWVDHVLQPQGDDRFVHGDLHGHNQVWDHDHLRLRLVVDYEHGGAAEAEYDFRYLPAQGPSVDLLLSTATQYQILTQRSVNIEHVMAWHIRTVLGDALWRSEGGVALPDGGTPPEWVDELRRRLDSVGLSP